MKTKLREFETLGFRPATEAQDKLIRDAQAAAGIKMSDLLRRAVLLGLPALMDEIRQNQETAFARFTETLERTPDTPRPAHHHAPPKRKAG